LSAGLSIAAGAAPGAAAGAAALALAPALAGFILLPRIGRPGADAILILAWLVSAVFLTAGAGGAQSSLAAALLIAPALAAALRPAWALPMGLAAALCFALASWLARFAEPAPLGSFPLLLTIASIAFAAALIAIRGGNESGRAASAIEQRVAEVSHELRTPLTHIIGFSEMIERQIFGEVGARYVEYAGLIRKSGNHLLGLVNDLLDASKIEAGKYELDFSVFDARAIIEEVVRLSADSADRKSIGLSADMPDTPLMVRADDRALRRMLFNTVGNGIKFTPDGGRVAVRAATADGALVIETIDDGPGIPVEERAMLGRAYERGSGGARAEGAGLGLALTRALARLHGGSLSFHDAPGGGALVRITLPVLTN
jgi:signal transduction histidine kinase